MDIVLGTVSVNAAASGVVVFGPLLAAGRVGSVLVWTDRGEVGVAGALLTAEVAYFARRDEAAAFANGQLAAQALPVPFAHDGSAHNLPVGRWVDETARYMAVRFTNGTAFNFDVSAGVEMTGGAGRRAVVGRGIVSREAADIIVIDTEPSRSAKGLGVGK